MSLPAWCHGRVADIRTLNPDKAVASPPVIIDRPLSLVKGALYTMLLTLAGDYNLLAGPDEERAWVTRGTDEISWVKPGQPPQVYTLRKTGDDQTSLVFTTEAAQKVADLPRATVDQTAAGFGVTAQMVAQSILDELDGGNREVG
jgi:hypothetical protein